MPHNFTIVPVTLHITSRKQGLSVLCNIYLKMFLAIKKCMIWQISLYEFCAKEKVPAKKGIIYEEMKDC